MMKAVRVVFVLILAAAIAMVGCRKDHADRTAGGWHVDWHDQGTIATGLHTLGEIHDLFDAAMARACAHVDKYYGYPPGSCEATLRKDDPEFTLHDHFYFPIVGTPADDPQGISTASGETINKHSVIVAFYSRATMNSTDPNSVPPDAPPWTVVLGPITGHWYWAIEVPGYQFPALDYELHWFFTLDPTFS